jgi:uncharacterized phage protein (TIGR02218 family)
VAGWSGTAKAKGSKALQLKERGRRKGNGKLLKPDEERKIIAIIRDKTPRQTKMEFYFWSVGAVTFVAELRGISEALQQHQGQLCSPSCRAILGDSRCNVNLTSFSFNATINVVTSGGIFTANALTQAAGYFTGGEIQWLTGANAGLKREIKEFSNKQIILALPMPYALQVGDTFKAVAGCDKIFSTCKTKFNNVNNFRGEPHVPGTDAIMKTSGTM